MKRRKLDLFEAESWIMMLLPIVFLVGIIVSILTLSIGAHVQGRAAQPSSLDDRVEM